MWEKCATSAARQGWLENALRCLVPVFIECTGQGIPENVRVSIGFPRGSRKYLGQCWAVRASADSAIEIFLSPVMGNVPKADRQVVTVEILAVLAHEVCHSIAGIDAGHKKPFKRIAMAVGLEGKMRSTVAGLRFKNYAAVIIGRIGPYPAGKLGLRRGELEEPPPGDPGGGEGEIVGGGKKQVARMLKCCCQTCGYTVRAAAMWIEGKGTPHCPEHGKMVCVDRRVGRVG